MKNKNAAIFFFWQWLTALFFLLVLGGCVVGVGVSSGGGLRNSLDVEELFRSATILPDHTYYIQGVAANPEAIIAVRNVFQLQSRLWSRVDWTEKELKDAVFWMQVEEAGFCTTDGGYLIAPGGVQVGIWYSQREIATVKQVGPGVVEIYPFDFIHGSSCHQLHVRDQF